MIKFTKNQAKEKYNYSKNRDEQTYLKQEKIEDVDIKKDQINEKYNGYLYKIKRDKLHFNYLLIGGSRNKQIK